MESTLLKGASLEFQYSLFSCNKKHHSAIIVGFLIDVDFIRPGSDEYNTDGSVRTVYHKGKRKKPHYDTDWNYLIIAVIAVIHYYDNIPLEETRIEKGYMDNVMKAFLAGDLYYTHCAVLNFIFKVNSLYETYYEKKQKSLGHGNSNQ